MENSAKVQRSAEFCALSPWRNLQILGELKAKE